MASNTGKVVGKFDVRALPAFGGRSANKARREQAIREAEKRARLFRIKEAAERLRSKK